MDARPLNSIISSSLLCSSGRRSSASGPIFSDISRCFTSECDISASLLTSKKNRSGIPGCSCSVGDAGPSLSASPGLSGSFASSSVHFDGSTKPALTNSIGFFLSFVLTSHTSLLWSDVFLASSASVRMVAMEDQRLSSISFSSRTLFFLCFGCFESVSFILRGFSPAALAWHIFNCLARFTIIRAETVLIAIY